MILQCQPLIDTHLPPAAASPRRLTQARPASHPAVSGSRTAVKPSHVLRTSPSSHAQAFQREAPGGNPEGADLGGGAWETTL